MNYIKQSTTFYKLLPSMELSSNAQCLYMFLLNRNNELGWIEEFKTPNSIIIGFTGLSMSSLQRARKELIQKGLIEYKKITDNTCGIYKIIELNIQYKHNFEQECVQYEQANNEYSQECVQYEHKPEQTNSECVQYEHKIDNSMFKNMFNMNTNLNTLTKQKENIINNNSSCCCNNNINNNIGNEKSLQNDEDIAFISKRVTECIGTFNQQVIFEAISYLDDLPREVIEQALIKTAEKGAKWKYTKTILNDWVAKGINTLEKVKAEELNFQQGKQQPKEETEEEKIARRIKELEEVTKNDTS